jgi:phosphohistidine phosphatase SixA
MPYLVRHAHAGDKRAWAGPDLLRPLSGTGRGEAHGLVTQLRDDPVAKVLSSSAVRCRQTVEPLAARRGLAVDCAAALGVDADPAGLVALLLDPAAAEAVVCSHGELIGAALERLLGDRAGGRDELGWPKGSTWVLEVARGQVRRHRYLPPLRVPTATAFGDPAATPEVVRPLGGPRPV